MDFVNFLRSTNPVSSFLYLDPSDLLISTFLYKIDGSVLEILISLYLRCSYDSNQILFCSDLIQNFHETGFVILFFNFEFGER